MNKQKEIKDLKDRIAKLEKELDQPEFEVGKWYKYKRTMDNKMCFLNYRGEEAKCFGIWNDRWGEDWIFPFDSTPATSEEIKEALFRQAEKEGYKKGVKIRAIYGTRIYTLRGLRVGEYYPSTDELSGGGYYIIYSKGKWAEIIKDDVPEMHGCKLKMDNGCVKFGCAYKPEEAVKQLHGFVKAFNKMQGNKICTISFWADEGIYPVNIEELEKINTYLEQQ